MWTDGSLVHDEETGASAAGAGGEGGVQVPLQELRGLSRGSC